MAANDGGSDAADHGRGRGGRRRGGLALAFVLALACASAAAAPAPTAPAIAGGRGLVAALEVQRDGAALALPPDRRYLRLRGADRDLRVRLRPVAAAMPVRWRLRIDGVDPDWVVRRWPAEQRWPRLPAGSHRLWIAIDRGHGWEPAEERILLVDSPWWQTRDVLLAVAVLLLAALAAAAWLDRGRRRRESAWALAQARRAEAERQSEAKTRFLATLGHELRTPLTGVLGMAELLQNGDLAPHQRLQAEAIGHAGRHLLRLVNDALDLARIEAGKLGLEHRPFALWPLLQEVAGLLQPMAEAKGLAFALACSPQAPEALAGDPTRLRQILFNLGHNAIKFCARGEVTIQVEPLAPQGLRLLVQDSGPGLDEAQQSRLFRRFEPGTDAGSGGCGLGLAISRELAVAMGGRIEVVSAPGQGARFAVELPLPPTDAPLPVPVEPPPERPLRAHRLLLVEDDPLVADVVAALLRERGHAVRHAAHALAALAELDSAPYDLAIVDLDLPGLDGLGLARIVRGRWPLPLLALTARADADAEPQARAAGMAAFLRKPVAGDELAATIDQLVGGRAP